MKQALIPFLVACVALSTGQAAQAASVQLSVSNADFTVYSTTDLRLEKLKIAVQCGGTSDSGTGTGSPTAPFWKVSKSTELTDVRISPTSRLVTNAYGEILRAYTIHVDQLSLKVSHAFIKKLSCSVPFSFEGTWLGNNARASGSFDSPFGVLSEAAPSTRAKMGAPDLQALLTPLAFWVDPASLPKTSQDDATVVRIHQGFMNKWFFDHYTEILMKDLQPGDAQYDLFAPQTEYLRKSLKLIDNVDECIEKAAQSVPNEDVSATAELAAKRCVKRRR